MKLLNHIIVIISVFLFTSILPQVEAHYNSTWMCANVNNENGLSNSAINCIYKDRQNQMWFGSWDGLNLFDGSNIHVFKPDIFRDGTISNNIIRGFVEDKNHNLWITTDNGINRLDNNTLKFQSYLNDIAELPVKEHNLKSCLVGDSLLVCALYGYGLLEYNITENCFQKIVLPDISNDVFSRIIGVYGQSNKKLFLLTETGELYAYTLGNTVEILYEVDISKNNKELLFDNHWFFEINSTVYIAVAQKNGGVEIRNVINLEQSYTPPELDKFTVTTVNTSLQKKICFGLVPIMVLFF